MITGNANMTREAVEYWVERLRQAEYALQLIAHHPIDTSLSAAAASQIAINYVNHNGVEPPAGIKIITTDGVDPSVVIYGNSIHNTVIANNISDEKVLYQPWELTGLNLDTPEEK